MFCCLQTERYASVDIAAHVHVFNICFGRRVATPMAQMTIGTGFSIAAASFAVHISARCSTTYRMVHTAY
jgi:phosphomevalonate kinase